MMWILNASCYCLVFVFISKHPLMRRNHGLQWLSQTYCDLDLWRSTIFLRYKDFRTNHFYRPQGKVMFSRVSVCPQSASRLPVHCSALPNCKYLLMRPFLRRGWYASYWKVFLVTKNFVGIFELIDFVSQIRWIPRGTTHWWLSKIPYCASKLNTRQIPVKLYPNSRFIGGGGDCSMVTCVEWDVVGNEKRLINRRLSNATCFLRNLQKVTCHS